MFIECGSVVHVFISHVLVLPAYMVSAGATETMIAVGNVRIVQHQSTSSALIPSGVFADGDREKARIVCVSLHRSAATCLLQSIQTTALHCIVAREGY